MTAVWDPLIWTDKRYLRVRAVPKCHTSTVVWCHGKGQHGRDWMFMVEPLRKLGHCNHICFLLPYLDYEEESDGSSISKNEALVQKMIAEEIANGADPARISVGGFNEGLDIALRAAMSNSTYKIASVMGITDRFAPSESVKQIRATTNNETPVFVVDRSGFKNNAGVSLLQSLGQPIGGFIEGSQTLPEKAPPVTQQELSAFDSFLHKTLPVEIAPKN